MGSKPRRHSYGRKLAGLAVYLLLISCQRDVDENNITKEIYSNAFSNKEDAVTQLKYLMKEVCIINGFKDVDIYTLLIRKSDYYGTFIAQGRGICKNKGEYVD